MVVVAWVLVVTSVLLGLALPFQVRDKYGVGECLLDEAQVTMIILVCGRVLGWW